MSRPFEPAIMPVHIGDTGDGELVCPSCSSSYLHSGTVAVFDRCEDGATTRRATVGEAVEVRVVPDEGSGNPSTRRHGVTLAFWCENCPAGLVLELAQHKGMTFARWRVTPA